MKTQHPRRRHGFTLIELLVVITIVAVLAGAGFAAGQKAIESARKTTAQAAAVAVQQAVLAYYSEYGGLPFDGDPVAEVNTAEGPGKDLLEVLLGINTDLNTRGIKFLTVKEGDKRGTSGRNGLVYDGDTVRGLYDPWGNGYIVVFNTDYEESVTVPHQTDPIRKLVAVYSSGKDESSDDGKRKDDVKSW